MFKRLRKVAEHCLNTAKENWVLVKVRKHLELEALIWASGLVVVALGNPESETHFNLFWPQWFFGIQSPGYGLGHSIGFLFRGDLQSSWNSHWLGVPVTVVLVHRIISLQVRKLRMNRLD